MLLAVETIQGDLYVNVKQCESSGRAGGLAFGIVKGNRLHKSGELIFSNSAISNSLILFRKNMFKRSPNCGVIAIEITILSFHVIFLDGA